MIRLLELRTEKGLSQREMAKTLCVSQGTYNNWENGRTQPSVEQWISLAHFFGVSVDYVIGNTDEYGTVRFLDTVMGLEKELVKKFRLLTPEAQKALLEFLEKAVK